MMTQIGMPVSIGVRYLGDHRDQRIIRPVAQPKADRVENMAQHPRLRHKLNLRDPDDVMRRQNLAHPMSTTPLPRRAAVVAVLQAGQARPVAGEKRGRPQRRGLGIADHIVDRIAKAVLYRAFAAMKGLSPDMIDARRHSAAKGAARAACIRSTTSTALASPSS